LLSVKEQAAVNDTVVNTFCDQNFNCKFMPYL